LEDFSNINVLEKGTSKSKNWLVVRTNVCCKYNFRRLVGFIEEGGRK